MISKEQVKESQEIWGNGVVKIGSLKEDRAACEEYASEFWTIFMLLKVEKFYSSQPNVK